MELRNKKTGEIHEITEVTSLSKLEKRIVLYSETDKCNYKYTSLAELNEEWEDYEEPEKFWYVYGDYVLDDDANSYIATLMKPIGNYFETKEEAEKAVEKLKAWKRLKDKGFRFSKDWVYRHDQPKVENHTYFEFVAICEDGIRFADLDLLFGGEK